MLECELDINWLTGWEIVYRLIKCGKIAGPHVLFFPWFVHLAGCPNFENYDHERRCIGQNKNQWNRLLNR